MKICITCNVEKSIDCFCRDKNRIDGYQPECKECKSLWFKEQYIKNRGRYIQNNNKRRENWKIFIDSFKKKCILCPEDVPVALDFHHLISELKEFKLASFPVHAFNEKQKQKFLKEIEKCVVVCSNCHRKIHAGYIKI